MLYREIMAVCSEIHTKHINTVCGQNVEVLNVKLVVHIVTTGLQRINRLPVQLQVCYVGRWEAGSQRSNYRYVSICVKPSAFQNKHLTTRDVMLPSRSTAELHSSGLSRTV